MLIPLVINGLAAITVWTWHFCFIKQCSLFFQLAPLYIVKTIVHLYFLAYALDYTLCHFFYRCAGLTFPLATVEAIGRKQRSGCFLLQGLLPKKNVDRWRCYHFTKSNVCFVIVLIKVYFVICILFHLELAIITQIWIYLICCILSHKNKDFKITFQMR